MRIKVFKISLILCIISIVASGILYSKNIAYTFDNNGTYHSINTYRDTIKNAPKDTIKNAPKDTLGTPKDSTIKVYTPKELKRMARDSIKHIRDSIRLVTPRILNTSAIPDSLFFKRMISWTSSNTNNDLSPARIDTTMNDWYSEYPFFKEDLNTTYLGTSGSASLNHNYFKRNTLDLFPSFSPYLTYSYTPETMPFYNTKSPYTELAYWGTFLSYKDKEETNVKFLHTQNITPALNLSILYVKWGAKGLLSKENTDNRTFTFSGNYLGKKYIMNSGFIHQNVRREENGGVQNTSLIRDTTIDGKIIPINLKDAHNKLSRNTLFLNHHYNIPIRFKKDSAKTIAADDGTMISIGHIGEFSRYYRYYTDNISESDNVGRAFYNNQFYINPVSSSDSIRMVRLDNKLFFRLQPWAKDAVVSKIDGGVGHRWLNIYSFNPETFIKGNSNTSLNNLFVYAGANGQYRKYLKWSAKGEYNFAGYNVNDFSIDADVKVSFYPFKNKKEGIDIIGRISTAMKRPDWLSSNYYTNHYVWNDNLSKISDTKIEGEFNIHKWKLSLFFGYSLINNYTYYDTLGIIRQKGSPINVMSAYLKKDFKLWYFHLDNKILFQLSSDKNVLPLPMLSLHLRYYFEYELVKNALTMQIGADATYNTLYYAPAYNPSLGTFQNQNKELIGNCPYIDIFVNMQWKRASIFLKCTNVAQGWPNGDYFSAYGYIKPMRTFKIGIHWPFYIH